MSNILPTPALPDQVQGTGRRIRPNLAELFALSTPVILLRAARREGQALPNVPYSLAEKSPFVNVPFRFPPRNFSLSAEYLYMQRRRIFGPLRHKILPPPGRRKGYRRALSPKSLDAQGKNVYDSTCNQIVIFHFPLLLFCNEAIFLYTGGPVKWTNCFTLPMRRPAQAGR